MVNMRYERFSFKMFTYFKNSLSVFVCYLVFALKFSDGFK